MSLRSRVLAAGVGGALALAAVFIGQHEGEVRKPYLDIGGVPTVCFGSTAFQNRVYTSSECTELLLRDVRTANAAVRRQVHRDMPASVEAAMTSATYNAGSGAFSKSPMLPHLREGRWEAACAALAAPVQTKYGVAQGWRATVKGRPSRGLGNRRAAEAGLCRQDLP